ncbi:hypothetical protein LOZ53_005970 [Ophidiomyces ophidiicola]|uniref:Uncharacterized protein n=1 Tax=Ophidiomyces ophidiicola TaxID=1387563 RepID=A0ACB8UY62_9EURO|nr:uncharacterized protein LOZ57_002222 [Ophidiomyces ophidiicola]KAI1913851.1 hypothetical protein LOZ61_002504 [Ophidiomyces ophidiicola]KAI1916754.1 hypothetical protein LOZ64_003213 [Ophidiomyces ophidiicola]KAI1927909.1 hypothetical protein LOZ60_002741 [Ophidiomyces ophidiicola]KAI1947975.1 hypothetical protein LOZ62_002833 [Ophidiomyces ophidiicola]KAI1949745.1 hypothetical protein LOZ57_002222 [Ophidiomyces ophidiicola]
MSREILDSLSPDQVAALPFPWFKPFFIGLCRKYVATQEIAEAIAAEFLVDGMDINEDWCQNHFASENHEPNFVLGLVGGKGSRVDDFSLNMVTYLSKLMRPNRFKVLQVFDADK